MDDILNGTRNHVIPIYSIDAKTKATVKFSETTILVIVVSIGWLGVLVLPVSTTVQVGVQAAMMALLGAKLGLKITKKDDHKNGDTHE